MSLDIYDNIKPFLAMLEFNEIKVNAETLIHEFHLEEQTDLTKNDYLLICKKFGVKCAYTRLKKKQLSKINTPFLYINKNNVTNIVVNIQEQDVFILDVMAGKPNKISLQEFCESWNKTVILIKKKGIKAQEEKIGFAWFLRVIGRFKGILVQILIAYLTLQIIGLFLPFFIQFTVDKVLTGNNVSTLIALTVILIFSMIVEMVLSMAKDYVFTHTTNRIDMILNMKLIKHLFRLPMAYFESRRVGDTIARVREIENIRTFLTGAPLTSLLDLIFVFVYIIIMFFYSKTLSYIVLAIVPVIGVIYAIVTPLFKNRLDQKFHYGADMQSFLVESMNGIHTIKSFAIEPKMEKKWGDIAAEYTKTNLLTSKLVFIANNTVSFLQKLQDVMVISIGATLVMDGKLTVGELVAFRMIASRISNPVLRFIQMWQDYQQVSMSTKRVSDIFKNPVENQLDEKNGYLPEIKGSIRFEGVSFRYLLNQPLVLKEISFNIPVGKIVGVIGRSGSGKSTLSKLIQRLYVPEEGKVFIDDIDICNVNPFWLRRQIGMVLQENFIFNGTLIENIAVNNPGADFLEIERVSRISGAHEFIVQLQDGYNTIVGEQGVGLSGGQKQRIAIARALMQKPKILIFDEATSALDYESERIIQNNLKEICQGRTVLFIAHRLSTLRYCDYIMSLDKGRIIEYDTPQNLLNMENSFYGYLMKQQDGSV